MRTIAARKTSFSTVPFEEASLFVETHHRQGMARPGGSKIAYGLYHDQELLGVAIFCNPRTRAMQKKYTTELFRLAFKTDVRVPGGASKLIKGFIRDKAPANLFTYQDTSGEAGEVYEKSGMTLVKEGKSKQLLLREGVTLLERKNNRKDWFSLEQAVSRGPDALLGTNLGEVFRASGKRKTNLELFQEELNYSLVEVPGDRIYEWENPNVSFYTYKISVADEKFYYYGRKMIRGSSVTLEDCLSDNYYGSGGYGFKRWRDSKLKKNLIKEVLGVYPSWRKVVKAEELLIGDLYKTDPFCLNVKPGGAGTTQLSSPLSIKECSIHGAVLHLGRSCCSCTATKSLAVKHCSVHGQSSFKGESCVKCLTGKTLTRKICSVHGEATHRGNKCTACQNGSSYGKKKCITHGTVTHQGEICRFCLSEKSFKESECPRHGKTLHQGETCRKCANEGRDSLEECSTHGESIHRGGRCLKCAVAKTIELSECQVHGLVKHQNGLCLSCKNSESWTIAACSIHGEGAFYGGKCRRCAATKKDLQFCAIHGETKHTGAMCYRCEAEKRNKSNICEIHGETSFQGDYCRKCLIAKQFDERECPTHGVTKHRNGKCSRCHAENMLKTLECPKHGLVKHRGKRCLSCLNPK